MKIPSKGVSVNILPQVRSLAIDPNADQDYRR
jgi:hypothetical protein